MHQKFTITIDKNSPQALSFMKEHIIPYITFLDESICNSTIIADYVNPDKGVKTILTEHQRYVEAKVTTFVSDDKIIIMTDENWTKALYRPDLYNGCSEFPEGEELESLDDADTTYADGDAGFQEDFSPSYNEGDASDLAEMISASEAYEESDKIIDWDYDKLIDAYKCIGKELNNACVIKMLRTYTEKCPGKSIIEYWDSTDSERLISSGHLYPEIFFLKYGKVISPEEIPDKMWHGMPTNIEMFRFNGFEDYYPEEKPDFRKPYCMARPITEKLAEKYKPTPDYVQQAEKELGKTVYVELCNNASYKQGAPDYWADTYTINDNVDHADTKGVLDYINKVMKLVENVDRSNDEFLSELGMEHDETMIQVFANYYSDDNDILEVCYDGSERQIVYVLFQPDSDENIRVRE